MPMLRLMLLRRYFAPILRAADTMIFIAYFRRCCLRAARVYAAAMRGGDARRYMPQYAMPCAAAMMPRCIQSFAFAITSAFCRAMFSRSSHFIFLLLMPYPCCRIAAAICAAFALPRFCPPPRRRRPLLIDAAMLPLRHYFLSPTRRFARRCFTL